MSGLGVLLWRDAALVITPHSASDAPGAQPWGYREGCDGGSDSRHECDLERHRDCIGMASAGLEPQWLEARRAKRGEP